MEFFKTEYKDFESVKKACLEKNIKVLYRDNLYYWNISIMDSTIAYAFLDNVKGKSMPITFMVILDINGHILHQDVHSI